MKKLLLFSMVMAVLSACSAFKSAPALAPKNINLALTADMESNKYVNLDYGIRINLKDGRSTTNVLRKYDASLTYVPQTVVTPEVMSFVQESTRRYMRTLGFNLDADVSTDYMLTLTLKEFNLSWLSGIGWSATVQFAVEAHDKDRKLVYPNVTAIGRYSKSGSSTDFNLGSQVLNTAYANALQDIDWDRIAFFLKKASSPRKEGNKQVQGEGNTALESTVIRWFIESTPRGADVSTRIVSSTPEVKNTNYNFVGSTPYESTETFDVIGLTYNNSGNVQIEVSCEKAGYVTQRRRFNLRQVIDQKEVSTKFNLIKEE